MMNLRNGNGPHGQNRRNEGQACSSSAQPGKRGGGRGAGRGQGRGQGLGCGTRQLDSDTTNTQALAERLRQRIALLQARLAEL